MDDLEQEIADLCLATPRFAWLASRARFAANSLEYRVCLTHQYEDLMNGVEEVLPPDKVARGRDIIRMLFGVRQCHPLCGCRFDLVAWAKERDHRWRKKARNRMQQTKRLRRAGIANTGKRKLITVP